MFFFSYSLSDKPDKNEHVYYILLTEYLYEIQKTTHYIASSNITSPEVFDINKVRSLLSRTVSVLRSLHNNSYEDISILHNKIHGKVNVCKVMCKRKDNNTKEQRRIEALIKILHIRLIPLIINQIMDECADISDKIDLGLAKDTQGQEILTVRKYFASILTGSCTAGTSCDDG